MTLREVARLLLWTRRSDKPVFDLRVAGGAVGIFVATVLFPSPQPSLLVATLAFGALEALLGSGVGIVLLLWIRDSNRG
jgi:hypothetical protein